MQQVSGWMAEDGTFFEQREDCLKYDGKLYTKTELASLFHQNSVFGIEPELSLEISARLAEYIVNNAAVICELLEEVE